MARLDVYPSPGRGAVAGCDRSAAARLIPIFEVDGQRYVLIVQSIATIPRREPRGAVTSRKDQRDTILAAIDLLFKFDTRSTTSRMLTMSHRR
jgi:hypothetical protein